MMYTQNDILYWVAKNMICIPSKKTKATDEEINEFISKYINVIKEVVSYMPRGMTTVGAAVANCAIRYDKEKAIDFIKNSKERIFNGKEDPAYHFYMWLHGLRGPKRKKHDISTYEITLHACRNYCFGKKIKRLGKSKDNFTWNEKFEINEKKNKKDSIDKELVNEFIEKLRSNDFSNKEAENMRNFIAAFVQKK